MITILIALIAASVVACMLLWYGNNHYHTMGSTAATLGILLAIATGVGGLSYFFFGWHWLAAESKAQLINREYGTNYTQKEIFFASDVIDTIREIDRKRIEVNGNVMRPTQDSCDNAD